MLCSRLLLGNNSVGEREAFQKKVYKNKRLLEPLHFYKANLFNFGVGLTGNAGFKYKVCQFT